MRDVPVAGRLKGADTEFDGIDGFLISTEGFWIMRCNNSSRLALSMEGVCEDCDGALGINGTDGFAEEIGGADAGLAAGVFGAVLETTPCATRALAGAFCFAFTAEETFAV